MDTKKGRYGVRGKYQEGVVSPWRSHSFAFRPRQLDHRSSFVGVEGFENIQSFHHGQDHRDI